MQRAIAAVGIGVLGLTLAGCALADNGGPAGHSASPKQSPAAVKITVTADPTNGEHPCPAGIEFFAYQHGVKPEGTQLTIKDANGKTVALSSLGPVTATPFECDWAWDVSVPRPESDFYTLSWGSASNTFTSTWMGKQVTTIGTAELHVTKADLTTGVTVKLTDYLGAWNSD